MQDDAAGNPSSVVASSDNRGRQPLPIFIIGTARSGTTWIGNLLASHPAVVGATAPEHHGVVESHLFDYTQYALPGQMTASEFVRHYEHEDYFRSLGLAAADFVSASGSDAADVITHFEVMMRLAAESQGARYWLEKTPRHAIYVDEIIHRFPDAHFVLVRRDRMRTVQGQVAAFQCAGKSRTRTVVEKSLRYASDSRGLERLARARPAEAILVSYEAMLSDFEGESCRLLEFLDLEPFALSSDFDRYSSVPLGANPDRSRIDGAVVRACGFTVRCAPFRVLRYLRARRDASQVEGGTYYTRLDRNSGSEPE